MIRAALCILFAGTGALGEDSAATGYAGLSEKGRDKLLAGEAFVLPHRPDEASDDGEVDSRFVTVAFLIVGDRETIWEVINDKDNAEDFLEGVLESEVLEEDENRIVVKQRTRVGGPKGAYDYTLRHELTPMERTEFFFVDGEIGDIEGGWWIFAGPDETTFMVVYSLHIDPGIFAPQFVIKRGMKKTMPRTLREIEREVRRRMEAP